MWSTMVSRVSSFGVDHFLKLLQFNHILFNFFNVHYVQSPLLLSRNNSTFRYLFGSSRSSRNVYSSGHDSSMRCGRCFTAQSGWRNHPMRSPSPGLNEPRSPNLPLACGTAAARLRNPRETRAPGRDPRHPGQTRCAGTSCSDAPGGWATPHTAPQSSTSLKPHSMTSLKLWGMKLKNKLCISSKPQLVPNEGLSSSNQVLIAFFAICFALYNRLHVPFQKHIQFS